MQTDEHKTTLSVILMIMSAHKNDKLLIYELNITSDRVSRFELLTHYFTSITIFVWPFPTSNHSFVTHSHYFKAGDVRTPQFHYLYTPVILPSHTNLLHLHPQLIIYIYPTVNQSYCSISSYLRSYEAPSPP